MIDMIMIYTQTCLSNWTPDTLKHMRPPCLDFSAKAILAVKTLSITIFNADHMTIVGWRVLLLLNAILQGHQTSPPKKWTSSHRRFSVSVRVRQSETLHNTEAVTASENWDVCR